MDWSGFGVDAEIVEWLNAAARQRYSNERKLDPYATSMRDFDDVSPHLDDIRAGNQPDCKDPRQRLTDLKAAGLVSSDADELSELGQAVRNAWEKYNVNSDDLQDELGRCVLLVLEAKRLAESEYLKYLEYWEELRQLSEPEAIIDNWDALYALTYLDVEYSGFTPAEVVKSAGVDFETIKFDLADYADAIGAPADIKKSAEKIERAVSAKIPRGRHRATFCLAMEIAEFDPPRARDLMESFGVPKGPRAWSPFQADKYSQLEQILSDYGLLASDEGAAVTPDASEPATAPDDDTEITIEAASSSDGTGETITVKRNQRSLSDEINFEHVDVAPPKPPKTKPVSTQPKTKSNPRKRDFIAKAISDDEIGRLGEEFALRREHWKLRENDGLSKQIEHVSPTDDSLGYDIKSFEPDGSDRFVEVKATTGPPNTPFFISSNELQKSIEIGERYVLVRVAGLPDNPVCFEVRAPLEDNLEITPDNYLVLPK